MRIVFACLICLGLSGNALGQSFANSAITRNDKKQFFAPYGHPWLSTFSMTVKVGVSGYDGDLSRIDQPRYQNSFLNPHLSIGLHKRFWQQASIRLEASYTQIQSESNFFDFQDAVFQNNLIDQYIGFQFDTRPRNDYDIRYRSWAAWGLIGLGSMHFQAPQIRSDRQLSQPTGPWKHVFQIPAGIGGGKQLSDFLFIGAELVYHHTFTDLLDGIDNDDRLPINDKVLKFSLFVQYHFKRNFHYSSYLHQKRKK